MADLIGTEIYHHGSSARTAELKQEAREDADIDHAAILRLCNEIEMIIVTVCDTGYTLQEGDEEAIMKRTKAIKKELTRDAGSAARGGGLLTRHERGRC